MSKSVAKVKRGLKITRYVIDIGSSSPQQHERFMTFEALVLRAQQAVRHQAA
jgi:hypothetical protein